MSIRYCKKCKLIFRGLGTCVCGRKLNTENEQYLDVYLEHGYVLHVMEEATTNEDQVKSNYDVSSNKKDLQDKRQDRREEKRKQREQILKNAETPPVSEKESDFDTAFFLNSLGLRRKNGET